MTRVLPLSRAVALHVEPGMHLHFASTPSRSNAAVREVARQFAGRAPGFVFSATGFHSSAHTLALLGLGRRYIGCFFGDNYPAPRPNVLYQRLAEWPGVIEQWSLLGYVLALRAGALGHPYAVTTSTGESELGRELARAGRCFEVPDPQGGTEPVRLLTPIVPDLAFLHAAVGTPSGRALFCAPFGEGFWGALAARSGVIVTVEKLVSDRELDGFPDLLPLPAAKVLAIAEEPFGAHPQPLHVGSRGAPVAGYPDDFEAYARWREWAQHPELFAEYRRRVLEAPDGAAAYRDFAVPSRSAPSARPKADATPADPWVLLAARTIARRIRTNQLEAVLAGIGQSFGAARLALLLLGARAGSVELLIETGISGFDPLHAHPFLLSAHNMAGARRLSAVEDNLGVVACGRHNRCLAVVGAAQADAAGNLNSSFVGGRFLVGSGGAADLTAGARDVVVLCRADRLVPRVEYVTSPGARVRCIVTEEAVLERAHAEAPWQLVAGIFAERSARRIADSLPFEVTVRDDAEAFEPTAFELETWAALAAEPKRPEPQELGRAHA